MKIGFLLPTLFASGTLYPDRIFAPKHLAQVLIRELQKRGHEVTVFSTPDFETPAPLEAVPIDAVVCKYPYHKLRNLDPEERAVRTDEAYKRMYEIAVCSLAYRIARERSIEVLHAYHDFLFTPHYLEELAGIPTLYTIHDPLPPQNTFEYEQYRRFSSHAYISISNAQRRPIEDLHFVDTIYHGVAVENYPFSDTHKGYLYFSGRLVPEKGLHTALKVADELGEKLLVATNIPKDGQTNEYYSERIAPYRNNPNIDFLGVISPEQNFEYMRDAKALLFPIEWEEPFGMVMIEAMATGTPVIAYNRGSVAEIVEDGKTGYIVPEGNYEEYKASVSRLPSIDRAYCRTYVEKHFTATRMVDKYESAYGQIRSESCE